MLEKWYFTVLMVAFGWNQNNDHTCLFQCINTCINTPETFEHEAVNSFLKTQQMLMHKKYV